MALPVKVLIAHGHRLFSIIIPNVMKAYGMEVTGHVRTAADLLAEASALPPQVVLMDIGLPGMRRFDTMKKLAIICPRSKIILHWNYGDRHLLKQAINAGCDACIAFDARPPVYRLAIRQVMKGEKFYCDHTRMATGVSIAPGK